MSPGVGVPPDVGVGVVVPSVPVISVIRWCQDMEKAELLRVPHQTSEHGRRR